MSRRLLVVIVVAVVVIALLAAALRFQPAASARVLRSGDDVRVIAGRIGFAMPGAASCVAPFANGNLRFRESYELTDAGGESVNVDVTFDYAPPARVPNGWASDGTWCSALSARVRDVAQRWLANEPVERLRMSPRDSGDVAAKVVSAELAALKPRLVAVRPRVSETARLTLPVAEIAQHATKQPPVIFIGLDGADWQLLDQYMSAGAMPNLASLVAEGTSGTLLTQHPPLSPLLWTSMMTGTSPLEHEILDFTRFNPVSGTKEPITSDERKVPAIWNMTTFGGKSAAVFGLWATYPAEPVRGVMVSDRFFTFLFSEAAPPPGVVYPPAREQPARAILKQANDDIGYDELTKYLPWLSREEFDERAKATDPYSHPVSALRRILIETEVYDRLARDTLRTGTPDLTVLYLQGTDSVGHMFAPYMPPRHPKVNEQDFARYSKVPELYFRHIDTILGHYKQLAQSRGARLMLASDHGFHWFEGRPTELSSFAAATAAKWHRKHGISLLWGPGIGVAKTRDESPNAPKIAQVAATLLALTGMPSSDRVAQPPIPGVPSSVSAKVDFRAHYKPVAAPTAAASTAGADEEIAKLKALGYVGAGEATSRPASAGKSTHTAGWYNNEALILKDQGKLEDAIHAYDKAIELDPKLSSALWNLSDLLFAQKRDIDRSDDLLVRAHANGLPEGGKFLIGRAIGYQRAGQMDRSLRLLEKAVTAKPDDAELHMFRGRYRIDAQDCAGALEDFLAAQRIQPENPVGYASAGIAHICLGQNEEARRSFARSLQLDPNQPKLRQYLQSGR